MDQEKIKELVNQLKFYINESGLPESVIYIIIVAAAVILFRRIICWYLRQNELVVLLKEIRDLLKREENKPQHCIKELVNELVFLMKTGFRISSSCFLEFTIGGFQNC